MPKPVSVMPTQPKTPKPLQSRRRFKSAPPTSQALARTAEGNGEVAGSIAVLPGESSSTTALMEGGAETGAKVVTERVHPTNTPLVEGAVWVEEEVVEDEVGEDVSLDREEAVSLSGIEGGGVESCLLVLCQGQEEVRELVAQQKEDETCLG